MANLIPLAIADLELQLASTIAVGGTSFTLSSATDDDGVSLPAGMYCFTVDNGTSNKEYLIGQLNGTAVTSVKTVTRQGVETSGAARKHRIGAPVIVTDFATIQRVADILRGQLALDGANPIVYDAEPTLADRKELATVGYVLDTVTGGTVAFDAQTIAGNAGEAIVAGNLVYFKTSDQEWYKTDADTAATVEGVQLGIALGTGSDGVSISGGVQIAGTYTTTGLTAGSLYYASNTAGAISSSAGTTSQVIGIALSTTKLLLIPRNPQTVTTEEKAALAGFGTPTTANPYVTKSRLPKRTVYDASDTWTKPTGLSYVVVEAWGGGGSGGKDSVANAAGGGGGGYTRRMIEASALGATETITIGAGGAARTTNSAGADGGNSTFGSLVTAYGGAGQSAIGGSPSRGGGGGGVLGAGSNSGTGGALGGATSPASSLATALYPTTSEGGGHGGSADGTTAGPGGPAHYGGGGGGSRRAAGTSGAGGTSVYGGNGGTGGATGTAGTVPGGGGGASSSGDSGAGASGRIIVTEYFY